MRCGALTLARALPLLRRVPAQEFYQALFATFAFVLGASIGSFLNVCIYRMPLDISVSEPRRSFCPHCKYQIPWHSNLPLITWIVQRGKCRNCGAPISVRYLLVELLTGLLFLGVWWRIAQIFGGVSPGSWVLAFPLFTFVALLVVATFIDFEHFIIPDEITWGGAAIGLAFSAALPVLHGEISHLLVGRARRGTGTRDRLIIHQKSVPCSIWLGIATLLTGAAWLFLRSRKKT